MVCFERFENNYKTKLKSREFTIILILFIMNYIRNKFKYNVSKQLVILSRVTNNQLMDIDFLSKYKLIIDMIFLKLKPKH